MCDLLYYFDNIPHTCNTHVNASRLQRCSANYTYCPTGNNIRNSAQFTIAPATTTACIHTPVEFDGGSRNRIHGCARTHATNCLSRPGHRPLPAPAPYSQIQFSHWPTFAGAMRNHRQSVAAVVVVARLAVTNTFQWKRTQAPMARCARSRLISAAARARGTNSNANRSPFRECAHHIILRGPPRLHARVPHITTNKRRARTTLLSQAQQSESHAHKENTRFEPYAPVQRRRCVVVEFFSSLFSSAYVVLRTR